MSITTSEQFVLVGDQTSRGLTIIPVSTPLTHLNYFDGKFLRADDFRLEQAYQRALVALTARGAGSGVVHGFELELTGGGAALLLHGGLAVSASGVVIDLPANAQISIADLITRSESGTVSPGTLPAGSADFSVCEAATSTAPDVVLSDQPTYLITIAAAEALCGEEERFDQLCADACLTETDRPRRVSGVLVRARRLALGTLPTSSAVTFTQIHLRSQVATAYFEAERRAIPDRISGPGLLSAIWCAGAEAVTADEVPIGVLGRSGDQTTFLDLWTARREMMEPPPQRYWAWRMAMRPWDAFLAQVLQFQCQLTDAATAQAANLLTNGLVTLPAAGYLPIDPARPVGEQLHSQFGIGVDLRFAAAPADHIPEIFKQAQDMNRISLTAGLDDPQHLEPVDIVVPDGQLSTQPTPTLPTYAGVVRLLPGTRQREGETEPGAFAVVSTVARDLSNGSNVVWAAAGHADLPVPVAPPLVGVLPRVAAPPAQPPADVPPEAGPEVRGEAPRDKEVPLTPDRVLDEQRRRPGLALRLNRMRALARAQRQRIAAAVGGLTGAPPLGEMDASLADDEQPTIDLWLDFEINTPLADSSRGDRARVQSTAAVYSNDLRKTTHILEIKLDAELIVIDRVDQAGQFGSPAITVITTSFTGSALGREITISGDTTAHLSVKGNATWTFSRSTDSTQLVAITEFSVTVDGQSGGSSLFGLDATLTPSTLSGNLGQRTKGLKTFRPRARLTIGAGWRAVTTALSKLAGIDRIVATFELDRNDHALDRGTAERDVATAVIETIGAQLSTPDRDPGFHRRAMSLLLGEAGPTGPTEITAVRDWVLFTRRRQVTYAGEPTEPTPTGSRAYVAYHAVINDLGELSKFRKLLDQIARSVDELLPPHTLRANTLRLLRERTDLPFIQKRLKLDDLGFDRVGVVQFAPGTAIMITPITDVQLTFASQERGAQLVMQVAGDIGSGDGEQILEDRLGAYRGAIATLIDTSTVPPPEILSDVPDNFVSPGIDGVLFTVGLARRDLTDSQLLYSLTESEYAELRKQVEAQGGFNALTLDQIVILAGLSNEISATFEGPQLTNADAVASWWKSFTPDPPVLVDLHPTFAVLKENTVELEEKRAAALLGGVQIQQGDAIVDAGDARSVVFMVRPEPVVEHGGQLLVQLLSEKLRVLDRQVQDKFGGYPAMTADQLTSLLVDESHIVARYVGTKLANDELVSKWWAGFSQVPPDKVVIHPTTNAPSEQIELDRAGSLIAHLGGQSNAILQDPTGDALGQTALVYVIRP
jgi:hypothetical protein